jgi:hypothetical protein
VPFTRLKAFLIGMLLLVAGVASLVGDVLIPGFLWGASLGGIWVVLAPFGLLFLGVVMVIASLVDTKGKRAGGKKENKVEKTD